MAVLKDHKGRKVPKVRKGLKAQVHKVRKVLREILVAKGLKARKA